MSGLISNYFRCQSLAASDMSWQMIQVVKNCYHKACGMADLTAVSSKKQPSAEAEGCRLFDCFFPSAVGASSDAIAIATNEHAAEAEQSEGCGGGFRDIDRVFTWAGSEDGCRIFQRVKDLHVVDQAEE